MVLQGDVAEGLVAPVGAFEFALVDGRVQSIAAEFAVDHLHAVEPVFDMVGLHDDAGLVELALRLKLLADRRENIIKGATGVLVGGVGVVHALVFGAEGETLTLFFLDAVFQAAVAV